MASHFNKARVHTGGFTLLEVLVAMTLFSVTLIAIFSGLFTTTRSWQASEKQIEINEDKRLVITFIKRQLAQLVPLSKNDEKGTHLLFKGGSDFIEYVAPLPAHRGGAGLFLSGLRVEDDLSFHYQPVTNEIELQQTDEDKIQTQVLIEGIESIEFAYFGKANKNDLADWYDEWDKRQELPELIRIRLLLDNGERYCPDIIVPVRSSIVKGQNQFLVRSSAARSGVRE